MGYIFQKNDAYELTAMLNASAVEKGDELTYKYCPYCHGGRNKDKQTFSINLKSGAYKCLRTSCGKQGHFAELARDFNFSLLFDDGKKKYKRLAQKKPEYSSPAAVEYMKSRGISEATANAYRITTRKDNAKVLVFPFYDENDMLTAIKYRKTNFDRKRDKNKEWFEKDTKPILFGMSQCVNYSRLIITEGQLDSLTVADCGFKNAVSVPTGANGFTWLTHCWDWIVKFKEIIVFGDLENGRMSLIDEISKRLPQRVKAVRKEDYLGEKDANDIYRKYGKQAIEKCIKNAEVPKLKNVKELSDVRNVDLNALPKIKTNIREVDRVLNGLMFGELILLSGKQGNGKSTFMSQLVCEALEQSESVFIYSGELADYHFKRWLDFQLAGAGSVTSEKNEYGDNVYRIKEEALEKITTWYKGRAYIYDNNFVSDDSSEYESLLTTIENVIKQYGVKLVCVDNLMTAMDTVHEQNNLYLAQSNFVGELKKIAIRYNVVIILVAHPRKSNSGFTNDDISGSADIANKVDVIMSYQRVDNEETYNGKLVITKNRLAGKTAYGDNAIQLLYSDMTKRITSRGSGVRHYGWEYDEIISDDEELIF